MKYNLFPINHTNELEKPKISKFQNIKNKFRFFIKRTRAVVSYAPTFTSGITSSDLAISRTVSGASLVSSFFRLEPSFSSRTSAASASCFLKREQGSGPSRGEHPQSDLRKRNIINKLKSVKSCYTVGNSPHATFLKTQPRNIDWLEL